MTFESATICFNVPTSLRGYRAGRGAGAKPTSLIYRQI